MSMKSFSVYLRGLPIACFVLPSYAQKSPEELLDELNHPPPKSKNAVSRKARKKPEEICYSTIRENSNEFIRASTETSRERETQLNGD